MNVILEGGEPFFFSGGSTGCLLIHGFTGAPKEMRWLGEQLASEGYTVLGVRLFAHATKTEDMIRARWRDWVASVEDGYHLLHESCDQIVPIGLSMGAVLAILSGASHPVAGIIACSAPISTPDPRAALLRPIIPILGYFWRFTTKQEAYWHNPEFAKDHLEYPAYPIRAVAELEDLIKEMRGRLHEVQAPVLLIHSKADETLPPHHPEGILQGLGSQDKRICWLENSGHVVTRDSERRKLFRESHSFIQRVTAAKE
jgi:carboxylesterase